MRTVESTTLEITPVLELELSRHDVDAARHTDRGAYIVAIKHHPVTCEAIQMGGFNLRIPVASHRTGALVISQEKYQVRFVLSEGRTYDNEQEQEQDPEPQQQGTFHHSPDAQHYCCRSDQELTVSPRRKPATPGLGF